MTYYPANKRYEQKAIRKFGLNLNRNTEPDMIEWLESKPNVAAYLKELIRKDMESQQ